MEKGRLVLELPAGEKEDRLRAYAERRGFHRFLVAPGSVPKPASGREVVIRSEGSLKFPGGGADGRARTVARPSDLEGIVQALKGAPLVLVEFKGERVIPLENLLAMRQGAGESAAGALWVRAGTGAEVPGLLGALEHGSDGVVLTVTSPEDIDELETHLEHPRMKLTWRTATVRRVVPGGIGERVVVDTTSVLRPDEGMLVGSQGGFLLLVASEAQGSRYTRPRPFRVNAGAIHSYTLLSDGTTRYLSELEPGDRVIVTSMRGEPRSVRVGRLKIERRPFALVEVERAGRKYTLFAQEAETVRILTPRGPRPVQELAKGDHVVGVELPAARHFGMAVQETIEER